MSLPSWFSLGRTDGGPSYYSGGIFDSAFDLNISVVVIGLLFVFLVPIVGFMLVSPSFRKADWNNVRRFLECLVLGFVIFLPLLSPSWYVAHHDYVASAGPLQTPSKCHVGIYSGLWGINITALWPSLYSSKEEVSERVFFNEYLSFIEHSDFHQQHMMALQKGWVWPLTTLTGHLGGEGKCHEGILGHSLRSASTGAIPFMFGAIYLWVVWCICRCYMPENSHWPLLLTGILLVTASLVYSIVIFKTCPKMVIMPDGHDLGLRYGWAFFLVAITGGVLISISTGTYLKSAGVPVVVKEIIVKSMEGEEVKRTRRRSLHQHAVVSEEGDMKEFEPTETPVIVRPTPRNLRQVTLNGKKEREIVNGSADTLKLTNVKPKKTRKMSVKHCAEVEEIETDVFDSNTAIEDATSNNEPEQEKTNLTRYHVKSQMFTI